MYLTSFVHAQYGRTPLLAAARKGHVEIAQMLMEKGVNIEAMDKVSFLAPTNWHVLILRVNYITLPKRISVSYSQSIAM